MAEYDVYPRVQGTDKGSASVLNQGISSTSASGGPYAPARKAFYVAAGAGGSADDVTIYNSALEHKQFLVKVEFLTITGVAMSTVTLRTAAAAGGSALSSALTSATAGNLSTSTGATACATALAADTSMHLRRSDSGVAGILYLDFVPTV